MRSAGLLCAFSFFIKYQYFCKLSYIYNKYKYLKKNTTQSKKKLQIKNGKQAIQRKASS